ncbi:MAG: biotin-dependent carboxyltransferase family protein [Natronospirillum sp.]|uniref:5-oxoprolinase subunit C family protein n=1 Tax=Natronospirillum sp. TaxID=2812955 RepID=UPI0025FF30E9|nr:biotin-dependent carboxyltransferase family protein [Natronospirillum sp.]MCH8550726.1 biotin-dependent carboxyltransferase family protein [Natronospirillum sp.]
MSVLRINKPGWFSVIQDSGRRGAQRSGLTEGGAADEHAYRWANKLLDNPMNAACVEVLMGNFSATLTDDALIAVTGADLDFRINDQPADNWSTHFLQGGDRIAFTGPRNGMRAYLGVAGGWLTPTCFGSRSVVVREGLGGFNGGPLVADDRLPFKPAERQHKRQLAPRYIPDYSRPLTLKVVPGYQCLQFGATDRRRFTTGEYEVSQRIDRMGYRLEGPRIVPENSGVISEGIALGAIQVPRDGQPIVLLRDRQTIGGYPKIGCVTSLGCSQLSQRGPGTMVRFEFINLEQAQSERLVFNRFFAASQWHPAGQTVVWP